MWLKIPYMDDMGKKSGQITIFHQPIDFPEIAEVPLPETKTLPKLGGPIGRVRDPRANLTRRYVLPWVCWCLAASNNSASLLVEFFHGFRPEMVITGWIIMNNIVKWFLLQLVHHALNWKHAKKKSRKSGRFRLSMLGFLILCHANKHPMHYFRLWLLVGGFNPFEKY